MQDELRAVCEGLAARLQRPVAIDDPRMHLLVHTAHDEDHDQVDQTRITSVLTMQIPADVLEHVLKAGIATADDHTVAVKTDGTLWAWGGNTYGQHGDGTTHGWTVSRVESGLDGAADCVVCAGAARRVGRDALTGR